MNTEKEFFDIVYEIAKERDNIEFYNTRINQLKSEGPEAKYKYEPNRENILSVSTLSHIEQICVAAKNKYNVAINSTSYTSKLQRMHEIAVAASVYYKALETRHSMLNLLEQYRSKLGESKKRLNELETWQKNGNVKEIKNEG